ncbi:MAG: hypothetical protein ACYDG5_08810, partial [Dehalococcoidales bacterium]
MIMPTLLKPTENLSRVYGRGTLLSILDKELILTRIRVVDNGRFLAETQNWSSYWKPIYEIDQSDIRINLNEL